MAQATFEGRAVRVMRRAAAALALAVGCFWLVFAAGCALETGFQSWGQLLEFVPGLAFVTGGILGLWRPLVGAGVMLGPIVYLLVLVGVMGTWARAGAAAVLIGVPALVAGGLFVAAWCARRRCGRAAGARD